MAAGTIRVPSPPGQYVTAGPPVLNLRPAGNIVVGSTVIPPPATISEPVSTTHPRYVPFGIASDNQVRNIGPARATSSGGEPISENIAIR